MFKKLIVGFARFGILQQGMELRSNIGQAKNALGSIVRFIKNDTIANWKIAYTQLWDLSKTFGCFFGLCSFPDQNSKRRNLLISRPSREEAEELLSELEAEGIEYSLLYCQGWEGSPFNCPLEHYININIAIPQASVEAFKEILSGFPAKLVEERSYSGLAIADVVVSSTREERNQMKLF